MSKTLALTCALYAVTIVASPIEKCTGVWGTVTNMVWTTIEQPTSIAAMVVEPTTSSTPVVESATSAEPYVSSTTAAATTTAMSSSEYSGSCSQSSPCTGQMTYYDTATSASNPSACDTTNDGLTELVVALPAGIMVDSDCGKTVTISYGGVTKTGIVVDKCPDCGKTSLDLSRAFFEAFDSLSAGRLYGGTWYIS